LTAKCCSKLPPRTLLAGSATALTRHQSSIHYESSRVAPGASKRRWTPRAIRDTPFERSTKRA